MAVIKKMVANYPYFGLPRYLNYVNNRFNTPNRVNPYYQNANVSKSTSLPNYNRSPINKVNSVQNSRRNYKEYVPYTLQSSNKNAQKEESKSSHVFTVKNKKDEDSNDCPFFELLGIKLYFDDILLICLIFFLYNENIDDVYLLLALVLLLLS